MAEKIWSLLELIHWTTGYFREKEIENPRLNVEVLLGKILNMPRVDLYVNYDRIMSPAELADFKAFIQRRLGGEPLQYIIGETGFYGLTIELSPRVLIPRPETELLVETALESIDEKTSSLADLGTGSGCIALAIASNSPEIKITATDRDEEILDVARNNARRLELDHRIEFIKSDMLREILPPEKEVDIIVSNPPYISEEEYQTLDDEVRLFEPTAALTDNRDGLTFYRKILEEARFHFKNGKGTIILELGYNQAEKVTNIARESGYQNIVIKKDYSEINRILKANYEKQ
jgi:release factor glutamine methyltransferase